MASKLDHVMTLEQATDSFVNMILPMIQESEQRLGHVDIVARSEAWSTYIDSLHDCEMISDWQIDNWEHPDCCND